MILCKCIHANILVSTSYLHNVQVNTVYKAVVCVGRC